VCVCERVVEWGEVGKYVANKLKTCSLPRTPQPWAPRPPPPAPSPWETPPPARPTRSGAQVYPCGKQTLKPGFHFIGSRVETRRFHKRLVGVPTGANFETKKSRWVKGQAQGLNPGGFKLWVNCIQPVQPPPHCELDERVHAARLELDVHHRGVGAGTS
jgi:hypothetical protein